MGRLHVISGDANMSPWATWMTLGTTSIVIKLLENGIDMKELRVDEDELHVFMGLVALDQTLEKSIKLSNGSRESALGIQNMLVNAAEKFQLTHGLTEEEARVLKEWRRVVDDLAFRPLEHAADRVEWIARKLILENEAERLQHLTAEKRAERLLTLDKLWDEISPRGIGMKLRSTLWSPWMPSEEQIQLAKTTPPATTRASIRGNYIRDTKGKKPVSDWEYLGTVQNQIRKLGDPYEHA